MNKYLYAFFITLTLLLSTIYPAYSQDNLPQKQDITIAVASNFTNTLNQILKSFDCNACNTITISTGSTGKITTQILQGAPYDIFLAANSEHPKLLETKNKTLERSRFTYAIGQLVLWAPNKKSPQEIQNYLFESNFRHIAIANPKLAPYGLGAYHYLSAIGLWDKIKKNIVLGENINQTFHFVKTGNAELGIIALTQALQITTLENITQGNEFMLIPQYLYPPIEQQAVLLKRAHQNKCAHAFLAYLQKPNIKQEIALAGYQSQRITEETG